MNFLDYVLLAALPFGVIYGIIKGLRSTLWLIIVLLGIILADYFLIGHIERIVLNWSGLNASNYPDAPGVAVLILNNKTIWASVAALAPTFIAIVILILSRILRWLINSFVLAPPSLNTHTRLGGAIVGVLAGAVFCFLVIIQMDRLPWAWTGDIVGKSRIIDRIRDWAPSLLIQFSGGKI